MNDGSKIYPVGPIGSEWNLFWKSFSQSEKMTVKEQIHLVPGKFEVLTLEQVYEALRAITVDRRKVHFAIEKNQKEIELNSAKLESILLVGGSDEKVLQRITELADLERSLDKAFKSLDHKMQSAYSREKEILQEKSNI